MGGAKHRWLLEEVWREECVQMKLFNAKLALEMCGSATCSWTWRRS